MDIDAEIDSLCEELNNSILHDRIEEIKSDLQKIIDFEQYVQNCIHIDYVQLASYLHNKHVFYYKQITSLTTIESTYEDNRLFGMLENLITQPYSPFDYIRYTKEWYLDLIDYIQ